VSNEVRIALRKRYAPPSWALLEEVRDATGYGAKRSADAIAMSLWPSRGLELHGIEIKDSRNDWVRELKNPDKAEAISVYCDRWWVVVSDESYVRDGELPPTWGLMALGPKGLSTVKEAPKRKSKPVTREFLASLIRRVHAQIATMVPRDEVEATIAQRVKEGIEMEAANRRRFDVPNANELLRALEEALGVSARGNLDNIPNIKLAHELLTSPLRHDWWIDGIKQSSKWAAEASKELDELYKKGMALREEKK
jgi:hypothetical protein